MSIEVFIADDQPAIRTRLRFLLGAQPDITVIGDAPDGRRAVDQIARLRPDVVIMDINMPELDGIQATDQIHKICPATQVIILSMFSTNEHVVRALRAGARAYLQKGLVGTEVIEATRVVNAGRHYFSPGVLEEVIEDYLRLHETPMPES